MAHPNFQTRPIMNGYLVMVDGSEIYFTTIRIAQKFFGFWADESIQLGHTLDEIIAMAVEEEKVSGES